MLNEIPCQRRRNKKCIFSISSHSSPCLAIRMGFKCAENLFITICGDSWNRLFCFPQFLCVFQSPSLTLSLSLFFGRIHFYLNRRGRKSFFSIRIYENVNTTTTTFGRQRKCYVLFCLSLSFASVSDAQNMWAESRANIYIWIWNGKKKKKYLPKRNEMTKGRMVGIKRWFYRRLYVERP